MNILEAPSLEVLDRSLSLSEKGGAPLHLQLRCALHRAIDEHFENGQPFWTEHALIEGLNLSRITVRRALDDLARDGILERHRRRGSFVSKADPSLLAQSIGAFVPDWNSDFLAAMLEQLAAICVESGRRMHVYHTHKGEKVSDALRDLKHSPEQESILLLGNPYETTIELYQTLQQKGYRLVNVETVVENFAGSFVGVDNVEGMRLGVEHLTKLGHQNIACLVNETIENHTIATRVRAFEAEAQRLGLKNAVVVDCHIPDWSDSYTAAYNKMPELCAMTPTPTAIFTVSDPGAWAAMKWLAEQRIRVPEQISVIGFDDARPSRFMHPGLTTVAHPLAAVARRALEILTDNNPNPETDLLHPQLVVRESTAMPASRS